MLIRHPRIYLDATGRSSDALLVEGGRVVATGDKARQQHDDGPVVDPEAACLFPALADAHCHLWGLGRRAGALELHDAPDAEAVLERVRNIRPDTLPTEWILGRGWDDHDWSRGARLTRADLDEVWPNRPVCLHRVDNHAVVVNSEALRRAGLPTSPDASFKCGEEGEFERHTDGSPTGLLVDGALEPILEAIPDPDLEEDRRMFEEAAERYRQFGIASAHLAKADIDRLDMLQAMKQRGELPLRLYVMADGSGGGLESLLARGPEHDDDAWLSMRAVKHFADGALGSGGALLLEPDREGHRGLEVTSAEALRRHAEALVESGWQMAVHAIGDRAARHVLDAFERTDAVSRREVRPRLEHAQMLTEADCARLDDLSTIASIQPIHLRSDATWAAQRLHEPQLDRLFPWRALSEHAVLAAGSDFPIEDPNPWHGIATALSRRDADGRTFRGEKTFSREEILAAYTTGAAHAAHWEDDLGRLGLGYRADIITLDRDPLRASPASLWDTEVESMWIDGESIELD